MDIISDESTGKPDKTESHKAYIREQRLKRKLEHKDRVIAGLRRRLEAAERINGAGLGTTDTLAKLIERSVSNALCNVRMIPVLGMGSPSKIVDITVSDAPKEHSSGSGSCSTPTVFRVD